MPSSYTIYLGKIPFDTQERDIKKFFKNYGNLLEIIIKKGYSFVVSTLEYVLQSIVKIISCS